MDKRYAVCGQTSCYFHGKGEPGEIGFCQVNADPRNHSIYFLAEVVAKCKELQMPVDTFETLKAECVKAYDSLELPDQEEAYKVAYILTNMPNSVADSGNEIFHRFSDLLSE